MSINQMYQYSLSWFVGHLTSSIDNTDKVDDVQQRTRDLIKYFTYFIYTKICRSLFQKVSQLFVAFIIYSFGVRSNFSNIYIISFSFHIDSQEKILFSSLIAKNVAIAQKLISEREWNFLISNFQAAKYEVDKNAAIKPVWVPYKTWMALTK